MFRRLTSRMDGLYPGNEVRYDCHPAKPQNSFSQCCKAKSRRMFVAFEVAATGTQANDNSPRLQSRIEARMAVFQFTEGWCNPARRHSALGYQSPVSYERNGQTRLESASPSLSAEPGEPQFQATCISGPVKAMQCVGNKVVQPKKAHRYRWRAS